LKHCWTYICTGAICHKTTSGSCHMVHTSEDFVTLLFGFPYGTAEINVLHDYSCLGEYFCSMRSVYKATRPVLYQPFMCSPFLFIKSLFYTVICKFVTSIKQFLFQNLRWEILKHASLDICFWLQESCKESNC
jgi:hypothetical protein